MDKLIIALMIVESSMNPNAYNKSEDAVGILQIRPIMVRDVNRIIGTEYYDLDDRWDKDSSIEMCKIYFNHYGGTVEEMARKWNGGPRGHKKKNTLPYWEKVKRELDKMEDK